MTAANSDGARSGLPEGWQWGTVGDACLAVDKTEPAQAPQEPFRYIDISAIDRTTNTIGAVKRLLGEAAPSRARQLVKTDDVLVSTVRPNLQAIAVVPSVLDGGVASTGFCVLRPGPGLDPRWLFYWTLSPTFLESLLKKARGVSYPAVLDKDVRAQPIPVPPLEEQGPIVERIEGLRRRISAGDAVIEQAQQQLVALRRSTSGAAVGGRLGSVGCYGQSGDELVDRIAAEMERLKAKRIRKRTPRSNGAVPQTDVQLPRGWSAARWGDVGLSQNGRAFPSADYSEEGIKLLRPGNLHATGEVRWEEENTKHLPTQYATDHPDFVVRDRELVINLTAQSLKDDFLGRVCMTGPGETCLLNQRIARLTPVLLSPEYVFCVFRSPLFRRYVSGLNKGSLIQHIFTSEIAEFVLPIPPLEEQERIVSKLQRYEPAFVALEEIADATRIRSQDLWRASLHLALREPTTA